MNLLSLLKNKTFSIALIIECCAELLILLKYFGLLDIDFVLTNIFTLLIISCLCTVIRYLIIKKDKKIKILSYIITLFLILSIINYYYFSDLKVNNLINAVLGTISLFIIIFFEYKFYKLYKLYKQKNIVLD